MVEFAKVLEKRRGVLKNVIGDIERSSKSLRVLSNNITNMAKEGYDQEAKATSARLLKAVSELEKTKDGLEYLLRGGPA